MIRCIGIATSVFFAMAALASGEEAAIVEDGEARAVVVVPSDAYPIAEYAAEELVRHVEKSTGVALSVVDEGNIPEEPAGRVFVGSTAQAAEAGIDVSALAPEAVVVDVRGGHLFIAAEDGPGDPESQSHANPGSLWGVYDVLDRELGVRWLWPGELGAYVPERDSLYVEPGERTVEPHFRWRRLGHGIVGNDPNIAFTEGGLEAYRDAQDAFLRRHRMNQSRRPSFGHMFSGWWDEYGEDHPEWFYKNAEGTRGPLPGIQPFQARNSPLCVSNPELHDKIIDLWKADLEESDGDTPELRLPEADARGMCLCEDCLAWDAPQPWEGETDEPHVFAPVRTPLSGEAWHLSNYERFKEHTDLPVVTPSIMAVHYPRNVSDRYARFWKLLHERAAEIAPDVVTTAYAYLNYFMAPSEPIELCSNIHVDFVPWGGFWFPRPIDEHEWVKEQWRGWKETGASLSYRPNYFHDGYVMPHVFARQFADMYKFIEQNGAVGTSFDSLKGQWAVQGPTLYLLARLHTRPEAGVEELLTEYYQAFGPASTQVKAYFDYWEAYTTKIDYRWDEIAEEMISPPRAIVQWRRYNTYAHYAHHLFTPEAFERGQEILDRAAAAVPDDPENEYTRRVRFLQKGLDHARKTAALTALFEDEEVSAEEREEAYRDLVEFRQQTEDWFISNLTHAVRQESTSWEGEPGYIGE